jgi:hypothetical protein
VLAFEVDPISNDMMRMCLLGLWLTGGRISDEIGVKLEPDVLVNQVELATDRMWLWLKETATAKRG